MSRSEQLLLELLRSVAGPLADADKRLQPAIADGLLRLSGPAVGQVVTLGVGDDGRGAIKLFAAVRVDRAQARAVGANLGKLLGMVQVLPADEGNEVRRWSPYRLEDLDRASAEAKGWAISTVLVMLEGLRQAVAPTTAIPPAIRLPRPGSDVIRPVATPTVVPSPAALIARPLSNMPQPVVAPSHPVLVASVNPQQLPKSDPPPPPAPPIVVLPVVASHGGGTSADVDALVGAKLTAAQAVEREERAIGERDLARDKSRELEGRIKATKDELASTQADLAAAQGELAAARGEAATARGEAVRARDDADRAVVQLAMAQAERDDALGRLADVEADQPAGKVVVDPVPALVAAYQIVVDAGARASACVAVLRKFLEIAPDEPRLDEALGIQLLRDDQVNEAITGLDRLGPDRLTPPGASALVEACFKLRRLPQPLAVLGRADWRPAIAQQLKEVPRWIKPQELLQVASEIAPIAPPEFGQFLEGAAKRIPSPDRHALFRIWFENDPSQAIAQVVRWAETGTLSISTSWVAEAMDLALDPQDRKTALSALQLLWEDAVKRRASAELLQLLDRGRDVIRSGDWSDFAVDRLRHIARLTQRKGDLDACAAHLIGILEDMPALREADPEHELALLLKHRVSASLAAELEAQVQRLRPVDTSVTDISTVAEALSAAEERFPGLYVLPEAHRSAQQRGGIAVKKAREALFLLGEIATRYANGELAGPLDDELRRLPEYKTGVSGTAKQQYKDQYTRVLSDGREILCGRHCDIGGGDGRAYFFVDGPGKRIILGHCGSHLSGKRDS